MIVYLVRILFSYFNSSHYYRRQCRRSCPCHLSSIDVSSNRIVWTFLCRLCCALLSCSHSTWRLLVSVQDSLWSLHFVLPASVFLNWFTYEVDQLWSKEVVFLRRQYGYEIRIWVDKWSCRAFIIYRRRRLTCSRHASKKIWRRIVNSWSEDRGTFCPFLESWIIRLSEQ